MKICIATDFHLSYRQYGLEQRENDFYKKYDKMIDNIIQEKPDIYIQLGDIFDTPYPKPISIRKYGDGLKRLNEKGIKCYGIIGNHTMIQRRMFYPIDKLFTEHTTLLGGKSATFDDVYICGIDYHSKTFDIRQAIDKLYEKGKGARVKIICLHQALKKDQPIGFDYDDSLLGLERFDYVFLGHLHKRILRKDDSGAVFHYVGSLNSCNTVEMADEMACGRGYSVLDTDAGSLKMVTVDEDRKYVQLSLTNDDLNDGFADEVAQSLRDYSVKPMVMLNVVSDDLNDVHEFVRKLENVCLSVSYKVQVPEATDVEKVKFDVLDIEGLIHEKFESSDDGDFAVEMYRLLGAGDVDGAIELSLKHTR